MLEAGPMLHRCDTLLFLLTVLAMPFVGARVFAQPPTQTSALELEEVPSHLHRLIEEGSVVFQMNDEKLRQANRAALTEFQFKTEYRTRYEFALARVGVMRANVRFVKHSFELQHVVTLSSDFAKSSTSWKDKLLRHEFDHIAISSDPRIKKLASKLLYANLQIELSAQFAEPQRNQETDRLVSEAFDRRRAELERAIRVAYEQLDANSSNGMEAISNRSDFLDALYSAEWFQSNGFDLTSEHASFLKSRNYQRRGEHYQRLDLP